MSVAHDASIMWLLQCTLQRDNCKYGFGLNRENGAPTKRQAIHLLIDTELEHIKFTISASVVLQLAGSQLVRWRSLPLACQK